MIEVKMMGSSHNKLITYILFIFCFLFFTAHITIGVVASQSPLKVSLVDLYSTPPYSIKSRSTSKIKVHVSAIGTPIEGANVSLFITEDDTIKILDPKVGGTLSPTNGITDENGDVSITYAPPPVESPLQISISATAIKTGYLEGQGEMDVQIQPSLDITVISKPTIVKPGKKSEVTVNVTIYGTNEPVSSAWVVLNSLNGGTFSLNDGRTNENGLFITEYSAPITEGTDLISISIEKVGFGDKTTSWISIKINEIALATPLLISPSDSEVVGSQDTLKWSPIEGAKEYELFLGDLVSFLEVKEGIITTSSDYTLIQPLSKGLYYWKVRAIDETGQLGPTSETRSFTVKSTLPIIDDFSLDKTTFMGGGKVVLRANISPGSSPIASVVATIKKQDSTTDKVEMELKDGQYEGIYITPTNSGFTPMEFEVDLIVEDLQGGAAMVSNPPKFRVLPLQKFNLTVRSTPEGLPTIPFSGIYGYAQGSNISLSKDQKTSEKFAFEYWQVDGVNVVGNITMDKNHEAVAVFKAVEEEKEPVIEALSPVTTPSSEATLLTEKPIITTTPPTTKSASKPSTTLSKTKPKSTSLRLVFFVIILAAFVIAISRAAPENIKAKVEDIFKERIRPKPTYTEEPKVMHEELGEKEVEHREYKDKIKILSTDVKRLEEISKRTNAKLKERDSKIEDLTGKLSNMEARAKELKAENEEKDKLLTTKISELESLVKEQPATKKEMEKLRGAVAEKEGKFTEYENNIANLENQLKELHDYSEKIVAIEVEAEQLRTSLEEKEGLEAKHSTLVKDIDSKGKELEGLKSEMAESDKKISNLESKANKLDQELRDKDEILSAKYNEINKLKDDLVEKDAKLAEFEAKKLKKIRVVDSETLGVLEMIKEIEEIGEQASVKILVRKLLKKDPKKTMKDVLAHLDEIVAKGLIKKDFLKNKDGIIEIKYRLTDTGADYVIDSF